MKKGFTLVELIIVIVIIGILSVAVAPKIFTSGYKERADVVKFITMVRYAQHEAMIKGGGYCIGFNAKSYYIANSNGKITAPGEENEDIAVEKSINAKYKDKLLGKVCFDYLGEPCDSDNNTLDDNITVTIDDQYTVIITPYAGGVYENEE